MIKLLVYFGERKHHRTTNVHFPMIRYENVYNNILGRSFVTILDVMASLVHTKMKLHNNAGKLVVVLADQHGALLIHEIVPNNPFMVNFISKRIKNMTCQTVITVDLDVQEDGKLQNSELGLAGEVKGGILRLTSDGNFEIIQLANNPTQSFCIEAEKLSLVKKRFIEFPKAYVVIFAVFTNEMLNIDPTWLTTG